MNDNNFETMEQYQDPNIQQNSEQQANLRNKSWKPFLKQLLICSGVWTPVFMFGLCIGAPTMFIPQIRREANNTEAITSDMASWLSSAVVFSGFPFVIILSIVARFIGRRIPFIITVLNSLAAFVVLYCSSSNIQILISNIMQGLLCAAQTTIIVLILTEYISPKYRGIFLTIKTATLYGGIWVANAIGTFFHWKNIPLMGIVCSLYTLLTIFILPESPYWLASRGRFEECAAAHRSLKGYDEDSEKELEALINSQAEYNASCTRAKQSERQHILDFFRTIKSKEFYKPTLLAILIVYLGFCSGKLIFAVYAIDVLKKIINSESTAYIAMLVIDGFTVLSMYGGCALSKLLKRRTLLLVASSVGVMFLFILSLYLYLISIDVITENNYVTVSLFVAFSIAVSCGPLTVSFSVYGECIPLRSRHLSSCFIALFSKILNAPSLKLAPLMFKTLGLHGACLTFGIVSGIIIIIMYKYLPETKDKTLQQIANNMNGLKPSIDDVTSKLMVY